MEKFSTKKCNSTIKSIRTGKKISASKVKSSTHPYGFKTKKNS